jgi:hypothetical protein
MREKTMWINEGLLVAIQERKEYKEKCYSTHKVELKENYISKTLARIYVIAVDLNDALCFCRKLIRLSKKDDNIKKMFEVI